MQNYQGCEKLSQTRDLTTKGNVVSWVNTNKLMKFERNLELIV